MYHLKMKDVYKKSPSLGKKHQLVPTASLCYSPPSSGGWGIVKAALLVPESVLLFVSPHGCGRHGSIAAFQKEFDEHVFYYSIVESDIVIGTHMQKIEKVVEQIMERLDYVPKAFTICATCIDDLLASDYTSVVRMLTKKYNIPFGECHMNPISKESTTPPGLGVQRTIYRYLTDYEVHANKLKDKTVNIIGSYAPLAKECELYFVLQEAGYKRVYHVASCENFEDFLGMSRSERNLLIKPLGSLACKEMKKKLDIPFSKVLLKYDLEEIIGNYKQLEQDFGCKLNYEKYHIQCLKRIERFKEKMQGVTVGIGSSINAFTFELAVALIHFGCTIKFMMSDRAMQGDMISQYEWKYAEFLRINHPNIPIYTSAHPSMSTKETIQEKPDVAIGFDAAYISDSTHLFYLDMDEQHYGFEAVHHLLDGIEKAYETTVDLKQEVYAKSLVV